MLQTKYIDPIPVVPDRRLILARLGYKTNSTVLSPADTAKLERAIREGLMLCEPKGAYRVLDILARDENCITLEGEVLLYSKKLSGFLKDSTRVLFMAATVGKEIVEHINNEIKNGDPAFGIMLDAVASEAADAILDRIMKYVDNGLVRGNLKLTKHRYSAGYGDFELENQKIFCDVLNLAKLGITLTESFMLVPEKSVTAVAGIERRQNA